MYSFETSTSDASSFDMDGNIVNPTECIGLVTFSILIGTGIPEGSSLKKEEEKTNVIIK